MVLRLELSRLGVKEALRRAGKLETASMRRTRCTGVSEPAYDCQPLNIAMYVLTVTCVTV